MRRTRRRGVTVTAAERRRIERAARNLLQNPEDIGRVLVRRLRALIARLDAGEDVFDELRALLLSAEPGPMVEKSRSPTKRRRVIAVTRTDEQVHYRSEQRRAVRDWAPAAPGPAADGNLWTIRELPAGAAPSPPRRAVRTARAAGKRPAKAAFKSATKPTATRKAGPLPASRPPARPSRRVSRAGDEGRTGEAYALVRCPPSVAVGQEFALVVGLSSSAVPDVFGGPLQTPAGLPFQLELHVFADGFDVAEGESLSPVLTVSEEDPFPTVTLHLTAGPDLVGSHPRIRVHYLVAGRMLGAAYRIVAVSERGRARPPAQLPPAGLAQPPDQAATVADLTVDIVRSDRDRDRFTFILSSSHSDLPEPTRFDVSLTDADKFAERTRTAMELIEGRHGGRGRAEGFGDTVSQSLRAPFWNAFAHVAGRLGKTPPSVLLVTDEPYVPWELATVPGGGTTRRRARFLGTAAAVGRWVVDHGRLGPAEQPFSGNRIAVVWSDYADTGDPLEDARKEWEELRVAYNAKEVPAKIAAIRRCLEGSPRADFVHFALHGTFDPQGYRDGLILPHSDEVLIPEDVRGFSIRGAPVVFLNACQVGQAAAGLGGPTGMVPAFVFEGASAVIAPLWKIDDAAARKFAIEFYKRSFASGTPPAEVMRQLRAEWAKSSRARSSTPIAFQFYGHPKMQVRWERPSAGGR